jgi:alpha-galactosidase
MTGRIAAALLLAPCSLFLASYSQLCAGYPLGGSELLLPAPCSVLPAPEPSGDYYDWKKTRQPERPYIHRYDQSLVMKIFLAEKQPDANLGGHGCKVYLTFEEALAVIERLDNITCGAPKIVYLVGWQHNGHDSKYPDWSVVNPRLKRSQDPTAADSLKWLMAEGFKHHTIVSLHVNMLDAYEDSPLWKEYLAKDIIAKGKDGRPLAGAEFGGQLSYQISYAREWETGLARKRIDGLLAMLPIRTAGTIHIDAFHSMAPKRRHEATISPYLGYPIAKEAEAQRKIFRYFRDQGVDVTSECSTSFRRDAFVGLQPMAWNFHPPAADIPTSLYCGTPMRAESQIKRDPKNLKGLLDQFCLQAAPWLWSNAQKGKDEEGRRKEEGSVHPYISGNDCCIPLAWKKEKTLLAYSRDGCEKRAWQLPVGWEKITRAQLADITLKGPRTLYEIPVKSGSIRLSLKPGQAVTVEGKEEREARDFSPSHVLTLSHSHALSFSPLILTPPAPAQPRINGPSVFGVRPGTQLLYTIPATGDRPMKFAAEGLPSGVTLDPDTGRMTGVIKESGEHKVVLLASNARGTARKPLRIIAGDRICLTPPMGWNSWNCWAAAVDQEKILRSAKAMAAAGLVQHGWTYVNIDDSWQGLRAGSHPEASSPGVMRRQGAGSSPEAPRSEPLAIQPNRKFPDMPGLCNQIHALGLKPGIYSTPWVTSYAKFAGGSSDDSAGKWSEALANEKQWRHGRYSFAANDARQWAAWGFDYLKYDWNPNDVEHVEEMGKALSASGRDIIYSLSNSAPIAHARDWARLANCWRTTGDIWDEWDRNDKDWRYSVSEIGFAQDPWARHAGPGHWNDPDMLVLGYVGWGPELRPTRLTPDEQYAHISLWCLLSAPLLIGCDMEHLDPFTLNLLTNDEVLALDQDALGKQATRVAAIGAIDVYLKELEDGGRALGFFNRGEKQQIAVFNKLVRVGISGKQHVRDLWRQKDLPEAEGQVTVTVPSHGVVLLKLW